MRNKRRIMDISLSYNSSKYTGYWSVVSKAVEQILQSTLVSRVSFEQMYSIVYKCVCDGFSEKMYVDLLGQCSRHLEYVDHALYMYKQECDQRQDGDVTKFVMFFHQALQSYLLAVQQITPVFAYMNKFYVEVTLHTSLHVQLLDLFRQKVADSRMDTIMASVEDLLKRPFTLSPAAMSSLFKNLHCIGRGDYSQRYAQMFSRYVPGIIPPMLVSDIEAHIAEIRELQNTLKAQWDAQGEVGDVQQGQKRKGDDENYGPTFCAESQQQLLVVPDINSDGTMMG